MGTLETSLELHKLCHQALDASVGDAPLGLRWRSALGARDYYQLWQSRRHLGADSRELFQLERQIRLLCAVALD